MNNKKTIAQRIKVVRDALKLTQKDLAQKINVSITSICEVEKGKHKPNCDFLENIARVFNINLYWLLFGEGKMFFEPADFALVRPRRSFAEPEEVRNFLWYYQRSAIVYHSTLANFYTLMFQQQKGIEEEVNEYENENV